MKSNELVEWLGVTAELLVAAVIYWEFESTRLDHFLESAETGKTERANIFEQYCGLPEDPSSPRNERFRLMLEDSRHKDLRDNCNDAIRLFSRVGARLPRIMKRHPLDWHVVVFMWEILGPYVCDRRQKAGPTFAVTFLEYARRSTKHLLKQNRDVWFVVDPKRDRKCDVEISRTRLEQICEEITIELKRDKRQWSYL